MVFSTDYIMLFSVDDLAGDLTGVSGSYSLPKVSYFLNSNFTLICYLSVCSLLISCKMPKELFLSNYGVSGNSWSSLSVVSSFFSSSRILKMDPLGSSSMLTMPVLVLGVFSLFLLLQDLSMV